jgi:hypothetical protein
MNEPFSNGRNDDGTFAKGNRGGPGNPRARYARQLRERLDDCLFKAVSPDRLLAAIDAVLKLAEAGDVAALKLLMERIAGPPVASDVLQRIEDLEEKVNHEHQQSVE